MIASINFFISATILDTISSVILSFFRHNFQHNPPPYTITISTNMSHISSTNSTLISSYVIYFAKISYAILSSL